MWRCQGDLAHVPKPQGAACLHGSRRDDRLSMGQKARPRNVSLLLPTARIGGSTLPGTTGNSTSASKAQRVRRAPPDDPGTVSRRAPFCASSSEAQRVRRAPPDDAGTVSRRAPFCASSLKAQRVRRAPPDLGRNGSRRTPFCACSLKAQRVRRAPPDDPGTVSRRAPFCASSLKVMPSQPCRRRSL